MTNLDAYAQFLTARWDEIEQAARAAATDPAEPRHSLPERFHPHWYMAYVTDYDGGLYIARFDTREEARESLHRDLGEEFRKTVEDAETRHVTIHDPAYVLADLAAKRAVLALFVGNLHEKWDDGHEAEKVAAVMLPLLAAPFRDHPDHPANQEA